MHDIRQIRSDPDAFDAAMARRGLAPQSAAILSLDSARRDAITATEAALAARNTASKQVGAAKAQGDEDEFNRLRALVAEKKDEIARLEETAREADAALGAMLAGLPNTPRADIPDGTDEADNVEIHRWGAPRNFAFDPVEHFEVPGATACFDFETAAKLSGSRFVILKGALTRLHRALGELIVDGIDTTTPLFHALLAEEAVQTGDYNIHWLEHWLEENT